LKNTRGREAGEWIQRKERKKKKNGGENATGGGIRDKVAQGKRCMASRRGRGKGNRLKWECGSNEDRKGDKGKEEKRGEIGKKEEGVEQGKAKLKGEK